jgi:phage shock protein C
MNTTALPQEPDQATTSQGTGDPARPEPLCRPAEGRMLAGVAAGIARYFGVDVILVRIIFAVLIFGGGAVPAYLAGWLLIPEEGASQSIAADIFQSLSAWAR